MKKKTESSYGSVSSDRIDLLDAATSLTAIVMRRKSVYAENGVPGDIDLDADEQAAYTAALRFMAREFDSGALDPVVHLTKVVVDQEQEHPSDLVSDAMRSASLLSASNEARGVFSAESFAVAFRDVAGLDGVPSESLVSAMLEGRSDVVSLPAGHYQVWG